jgi:excisionase family DNA binding protein
MASKRTHKAAFKRRSHSWYRKGIKVNEITEAITIKRDGKAIMTCDEVAEYLRVHVSSVRRWSRSGKLAAFKVGERGDWRYRQQDVIAFLYDGNARGQRQRGVMRMQEA